VVGLAVVEKELIAEGINEAGLSAGLFFFRISRSYIVSINAIENISKHLGTRLKMQLNPPTAEEVVVSRSRTSDFLEWLDNN
jgi:DNA-binding LytR/AlgR family response regulator